MLHNQSKKVVKSLIFNKKVYQSQIFQSTTSKNVNTTNTQDQNQIQNLVKQIISQGRLTSQKSELENHQKLEKFVQNLDKVRKFDNKVKVNLEKAILNFQTHSIASPAPLRNILQYFQVASKFGFDQQLVTSTLQYLAKTYQSFPKNSIGFGDLKINELHESWRFLDLIEDIKYGLKKGVNFDLKNIAIVVESLKNLDYKNNELQNLVFEKVERILNNADEGFELDLKNISNNPQIHKKYYYSQEQINSAEVINNQQFQKYIQNLQSIQQENEKEVDSQQQNNLNQNNESQDEIDTQKLIIELNSLLSNQHGNVQNIISSIVALREQYYKLVYAQNFVSVDPLLNQQLLELEELLAENGFITLEEIQNPGLFQDYEHSVKSVSQIAETFLAGEDLEKQAQLNVYLSTFANTQEIRQEQENQIIQQNLEKQLKHQQEAQSIDYYQLSKIYNNLSQISNLKVKDTCSNNYISERWEEALKQDEKYKKQDLSYNEEEGDRVYTTSFHKTLKNLQNVWQNKDKFIAQNKNDLATQINLLSAFLNTGLSTPATEIFQNIAQISNLEEQFQQLSNVEFFQLTDKSTFLNNTTLDNAIEKSLQQRLDNGQILFIDEILDSLEFLYTRNISNLGQNTLFQQLAAILYDDLSNVELNALDLQTQQKLASLSLLFQVEPQLKTINTDLTVKLDGLIGYFQQKNQSPVREKVVEYLKNLNTNIQENSLSKIEYKHLPQFLQPDFMKYQVKNGALQREGLYLLDSQHISIDQDLVDGRVKFWNNLLQKAYSINGTFVRYLTLENDKLELKNTVQIQDFASQGPSILTIEFQQSVLQSTKNNVSYGEIARIFERIDILQSKVQEGVEVLALSAIEEIKFSLYELSQILKFLPEQQLENIKTSNQISGNIEAYLKGIAKEIEQSKESVMTSKLHNYNFIGKRLTSQLLQQKEQQEQQLKSQPLQFLDIKQLNKKGYHDYQDWEQKLVEELNIANLMSVESSTNTNVLSAFQDYDKKDLTVIPNKKVNRFLIKPVSYPLNWEALYYQRDQERDSHLQKIEYTLKEETLSQISQETKLISNLQNLKYEIKQSQNLESNIEQLLLNLELVEELAQSHLQNNSTQKELQFTKVLVRDADSYFNYLENNSTQEMYNSQYLNFFLEKVKRKQKIISLWNLKNKGYLQEQYKLLQKGKITSDEFNKVKKNINKELISELKSLESNQKEEVLLQGPSRKIVDIKMDINTFIQDKQLHQYVREQDKDFISTNGDLLKSLDIKRFRAEQVLIKSAILLKLSKNITLKESEKAYAKAWINEQLQDQEFTYRSIDSLSQNDQSLFQNFKFSDITQFKEYPLNDVVMEISQLLNQQLISDFEFPIKENILKQDWNINPKLLNQYQNDNQSNFWVNKAENIKWNEGEQLNQEDLDTIMEMTSILRNNTPQQKIELSKNFQKEQNYLQKMNSSNNRLQLIEKYIALKEEESNKQIDVSSLHNQIEQKVNKIWTEIFQNKYEETNENQLHIFTQNLVQRFHLLSKFPPLSLAQLLISLLSHPKLNSIDKDTITAFLNVFQPEIKFDSLDIIKIAEGQVRSRQQELSYEHIKNKIRESSTFQYKSILDKIQQL